MRIHFLSRLSRLAVLGLVAAGLSLSVLGCEFLEPDTVRNVKEATGVDMSNPTQLVQAVAGGGTLGNKNQEDALDVAARYRRNKHFRNGEYATDPAIGLSEFQKSLDWTNTDTRDGKDYARVTYNRMGEIYMGYGGDYRRLAEDEKDPVKKADFRRLAAAKYRTSAATYLKGNEFIEPGSERANSTIRFAGMLTDKAAEQETLARAGR